MPNHPKRPNELDDKFANIIFALEEALFEMGEIEEKFELPEKEAEDAVSARELAQSARDLFISVIASINGKKLPSKF